MPAYGKMTVGGRSTTEAVLLKHSPVWRLAIRAATRKAREQIGVQPKAATAAHVRTIMKSSLPTQIKACIILTWITASRVGDILKLRVTDLNIGRDRAVSITFMKGKTVAKRGAFTVSSHIPNLPNEAKEAVEYLMTAHATRSDSPLFPNIKGADIKNALRTTTGDKLLEQRSLRRGSLQELAAQGMPLATLILFSGHTSTAMLLRYLGHGRKAQAQNASMVEAARLTFTG